MYIIKYSIVALPCPQVTVMTIFSGNRGLVNFKSIFSNCLPLSTLQTLPLSDMACLNIMLDLHCSWSTSLDTLVEILFFFGGGGGGGGGAGICLHHTEYFVI